MEIAAPPFSSAKQPETISSAKGSPQPLQVFPPIAYQESFAQSPIIPVSSLKHRYLQAELQSANERETPQDARKDSL
jgi:hypothetical protein